MQSIIEEFEAVKRASFELNFRYPTPAERNELKIIHRDVPTDERKRLEARQRGLLDWLDEVQSGSLHYEDLDEDTRKKLEAVLNRKL